MHAPSSPLSLSPSPPPPALPSPRRAARITRAPLAVLAALAAPAACSVSASPPDDAPLTPPFTVSDHFAPTGYMGDGTAIGAVNQENDACSSRAPNPNGAVGDCYKITYTPSNGWAGVYWQYPANNWGAKPGRTILPGATHLSLWAMGARGGEKLELHVGGIHDDTLPYRDSIDASTTVTLTAGWQEYTVNFGPKTYDQVIGAFAWIAHAAPGDPGPIVFYLDGITWGT